MGRFISKDTWAGDYQNPIKLTKWLYANANPVIYVDPSGNIAESEDKEAVQIINDLVTYGVSIKQDWSGVYKIELLPNPLDPNKESRQKVLCSWNPGKWSLNELYIVKGAIQNLDAAMKNKMLSKIGQVSISKDPNACGRGCTTGNKITLIDKGLLPTIKPISINSLSDYYITSDYGPSNFDQWSVVHELAHAWENYNKKINGAPSLSSYLMSYTGGYYSPGIGCKKKSVEARV